MILILNGPNLNLLGQREKSIYGQQGLAELEQLCRDWAAQVNTKVICVQSNHEGVLLDQLHTAVERQVAGVVLNAGAYTHTSVALRDAIAGIDIPVIEVHISNVYARESFRHHSMIAPACIASICGLGFASYRAAIEYFARS